MVDIIRFQRQGVLTENPCGYWMGLHTPKADSLQPFRGVFSTHNASTTNIFHQWNSRPHISLCY